MGAGHLARLRAKVELLKLYNWKAAWGSDKGLNPAGTPATKVYGTELALNLYRMLMEVVGQAGYLAEGSAGGVSAGPPRAAGTGPDHLHLRRWDEVRARHHLLDRAGPTPGSPLSNRLPPRRTMGLASVSMS